MPGDGAKSKGMRFEWLDSVKGMAVLWIALYHCLLSYGSEKLPWPITIDSLSATMRTGAPGSSLAELFHGIATVIAAIIQRGPQAVGVFILFSGFGLTYSLVKRGASKAPWPTWYRRRLTRLFPVYWVAHLIFLVSPLTVIHNHIDYRFLLSFLGDRVIPVEKMFFYLVPAWWFMGLLIELYIFYPLLFTLLERVGWVKYLALCILVSVASRFVLNDVLRANGYYEMGAFFVCRLWEFGAGMAFGKLMAEKADWTLDRLLSWKGFLAGLLLYVLGLFFYQPNFLYFFSDGFTSLGLSAVMVHLAYLANRLPGLAKPLAKTGAYSYGIYLLHQPYMMYAGRMLRPEGLGVFLALACVATLFVALFSIAIEYGVNRALKRLSFPDGTFGEKR
ncbi:MAG: acyltransferase [Syntrophobacteraceae bacterium]|nr:acyltransferase [Syntrophobacteraceae bacterium]